MNEETNNELKNESNTELNNAPKKNNTPLIICIVIIVILLGVICFLLLSGGSKEGNNTNTNTNENTNTNTNTNTNEIDVDEPEENPEDIAFEYEDVTNNLDNIYYNGEKQEVKLVNASSGPGKDLYINGIKVYTDKSETIVGLLHIDYFILTIGVSNSFTSGASIKVYNMLGEYVVEFYVIDGNNVTPTVTSLMNDDGTKYQFNISDNKLKFSGHQNIEGDGRIYVKTSTTDNHTKLIPICNIEELNNYGIFENTAFSGDYELVYSKKSLFTVKPVEGTIKTFKDAWQEKNCK